ncbi:MAG: PilZ domain-containing protein [Candidatus Omnitrophica bacterium]|nr:PilZ domain-containing protein [Candidatus Omnitrophota bacterium]MBU4333867.1 PilZ domain-containing protein [Candidatus Omnitrophota bacterium]
MSKTQKSGQERRYCPRAKRIMSIEYRLVTTKRASADKNWHLSITQDMSCNGLTFYSEQELKKDEILDVNVIMSGILEIYKGQCKVVRVERKNTGANFLTAITFEKKVSKAPKKETEPKKKVAKKI